MLALASITDAIAGFFTPERVSLIIRVALVLGIGFPILTLLRKLTIKLTQGKLSPQSEQLTQRSVY